MAKVKLNSALKTLRGRVGDLIFKQYSYGLVVTRPPRMDKVKFSRKQLAHQRRMQAAGKFYQQVQADPKLWAKYARIAARRGIPVSAVTCEEFMKRPVAVRRGGQRNGRAK